MKNEKIVAEEIIGITNEIEANQKRITGKKEDAKSDRSFKSAIKRQRSRLEYLKFCKTYLSTSPTEEFLTAERDRLSNRVSLFLKNYKSLDSTRHMQKEISKHRSDFEKEHGIPKLRRQLQCLNYLLS